MWHFFNSTIDIFSIRKKKTHRVIVGWCFNVFFSVKNHQASASAPGLPAQCLEHTPKSHEAPKRVGDDFHHIPSHLNEELFFIDCAVSGTHHLRSAAYDQWRHGGGVRTPRKENVWDFLKYRSWLQKQFNVLIFSSEANAHASWVDGKSPEHTETRCNFFKYPRKSGECDLDKVFNINVFFLWCPGMNLICNWPGQVFLKSLHLKSLKQTWKANEWLNPGSWWPRTGGASWQMKWGNT